MRLCECGPEWVGSCDRARDCTSLCVSKGESEFMGVIGVPVTLPLCGCHQWDWKKVEMCVWFAWGRGSGT